MVGSGHNSADDGRGAVPTVADAASTHSEFSAPSIGTVSPHNDGEADANTGGSDDRTQVDAEPPSPSGGEQGGGAVDEPSRQEGSPAPDDEDIPAFLDRRSHSEAPA